MTALARLTSSSRSAAARCPRLYFYRYGMGLARTRSATPLRFGSGFHHGLELAASGMSSDLAIQAATADYATCPDWADPTDWAVECETLKALLAGHFWRYGQDNLEFVAVETTFEIPLVNPDTGAVSRSFTLAGKIDAIIRLSDGRLAVQEYKTAGEDVGQGSEYWARLRCDGQISMYVLAARALGHDVATVLYDVTRKPSIRLRQNETPEQYGQRLLADISDRPDFYFQRREVPRLDEDLAQFQAELWQQAQQLLEIRRRADRLANPAGAWFRNVSRMTCGYCEFSDLCLNGTAVEAANPPAGYQILTDVNPELATEGA